ncbi:MAG: nicotinamide riboside transporter PnuC [Alloprevotella sp.]|nr:nicotinamide riboside transporter PnuC [Alloprevotella sp.]
MDFMTLNGWIEIIGTILGLVYVYYQYKASPKLWWACCISAVPLIYLNFYKGYLATGLLYLYYFVMAVWQLTHTSKASQEAEVLRIARVPKHEWLRIAIGTSVVFAILFSATQTGFFGLLNLLDMPAQKTLLSVAIADSAATTLCFVGMWLLSKNYLEQWYAWLTADVLFFYMYFGGGNYLLMGMMIFYIIVSVIGLLNWQRLYKEQMLLKANV